MKQLRVLTGRHAGAQLRLTAPSYRIAADEQADIQIVDWPSEPLVLDIREEGQLVAIALESADAAAAAGPGAEALKAAGRLFEDFIPRRFGDVVLCVGPEEGEWPSDMLLLERLMKPAPAQAQTAEMPQTAQTGQKARGPGLFVAACVVTALLVGGYTLVVSSNATAAKVRTPTEPLLARVREAVFPAAPPGLRVAALGDRVLVEGLLASSAEVAAVRELLARFPAEQIEHRYAAASDVAQSISDALSSPELAVAYRGRGVFAITGRTTQPDKLRQAASRIAADLAPLVSSIDVVAAEAQAPDRVPVEAMLSSDGLQYVQTRDGAKHLSLLPGPIVELIDPPSRPVPTSTLAMEHAPS
jgi:type III secretion protein D